VLAAVETEPEDRQLPHPLMVWGIYALH
jgi:hypothetical protein